MKRAVIFAHYDRDNLLDDYVLYYLKQLGPVSEHLVFVTTSCISKEIISKLNEICTQVVVRKNVGHDFMSYKLGLTYINVHEYDEVVLCNDSVYGSVFPLVNVFDAMAQEECSFWGVTQSFELSYHLQSYFLVFRKDVIASSSFLKFWDSVTDSKSKTQIINDNEVGLTRMLIEAGFKPKSLIEYEPSWRAFLSEYTFFSHLILVLRILLKGGWRKCNVTHVFWKSILLNNKMPFIKIDLLRDNYLNLSNIRQYKDVVQQIGDGYPIELIEKHLVRMANNQ
jgi:rhamnosyltransferase